VFAVFPFYVSGQDPSRLLQAFVLFLLPWFFPLLFFICGAAAFYSLSQRSVSQYLKDRGLRLLVPLAFGIPVLAAPQLYLQDLQSGDFTGNILQWFPERFVSGFDWCHLWFLAYLLVFSMIALPFFKNAIHKKREGDGISSTKAHAPALLLLMAAIPVAIQAAGGPAFFEQGRYFVNDLTGLLLFFFFFIAGFAVHYRQDLQEALDRYWKYAGAAALFLTALFFAMSASDSDTTSPAFAGPGALAGALGWMWVLTFAGLARKHLQFEDGLRDYGNRAALPLYLLHQPIIVAVAYHVVEIQTHSLVKFVIVDIIAFALAIAAYELIIRRFQPLRVLFGMRKE
jgi:hypothetical protein